MKRRIRSESATVTEGVTASRCLDCGRQTFPLRRWCPACGSSRLAETLVVHGRITEATTLRRAVGGPLQDPVRIGSVLLDGDGVVIARLEQETDVGDRVRLFTDAGAPVARSSK